MTSPSGTFPGSYAPVFRTIFVGFVLSAVAALLWQQWLLRQTMREVREQAAAFEHHIGSRMESYLSILRGGAGLFAASDRISRREFRDYVAPLDIGSNYPGTQGIGFSRRIPADELGEFVAEVQRSGRFGFRVWPEGPRDEYHTILFLEPEDARNLAAIGYDMFSEPVRRAAMERARDTGGAAITGRVTLVQEIDDEKQPGFLIYFPVYAGALIPDTVEERRARLRGFVYAPFRAHDFLRPKIEQAKAHGVSVAVFDGTEAAELGRYYGHLHTGSRLGWTMVQRSRRIQIGDRTWTIVYEREVTGLISWWGVLLLGLLGTAGVSLLISREQRALHRAEQSEAETREREGELALLVEAMPGLVAFIDNRGIFRMLNGRLLDWFDIAPEALVGRALRDVATPATYAQLEPLVERAHAGETLHFERWFNPAQNNFSPAATARYLAVDFVPHRSASGGLRGFYAVASDLTAHKRAEDGARFVADCSQLLISARNEDEMVQGLVRLAVPRVADTAALFRVDDHSLRTVAVAHADLRVEPALINQFSNFSVALDGPSGLVRAARTGQVEVLPQISAQELTNLLKAPEHHEVLIRLGLKTVLHVPVVVRDKVWAVLTLGTTGLSGRRFSASDLSLGTEISTRMRLAVENALLFAEAKHELQERRRVEQVVRETEERLRLFVGGARDYAMILLNVDGTISSWNEGAERILGFTEDEAIGMHFSRLFSVEDRRAGMPEDELKLAATAGSAPDERWHVRKDGTRFWASGHTVALREEGETVRGFAKIMRDLTGMKLTGEELERRVSQRTLELNEAVQELEAFSYSVSHDLRSPLRSIRSFTQFTIEEAGAKLSAEELSYLDRVQRAAARLDRLITDLLAYTRVSKNRVELTEIPLDSLVGDIQREHDEFQPPRAHVRIEGPLGVVLGNEAYLTQCITNLLGNAVKFMPVGRTPEVRIWTERHGANLRLNVSDNGIGIAPEHQARVFEIFERLHRSDYEGTGVGLAIVRRAVQRMNGTVGVVSDPDNGTTFWIELPAATLA